MNIIKPLLLIAVVGIVTCSCTTYYLSVNGLAKQVPKVTTPPVSGYYNNVRTVMVKTKDDKDVMLPVTIHTGMRITNKEGKRTIVLFDTSCISDSLLYANRSHLLNLPIKPVRLKDIVKLELQK